MATPPNTGNSRIPVSPAQKAEQYTRYIEAIKRFVDQSICNEISFSFTVHHKGVKYTEFIFLQGNEIPYEELLKLMHILGENLILKRLLLTDLQKS